MSIHRLNHAVLFVRDVERSIAFYRDILGFSVVMKMGDKAFLRADGSQNDHDLGLFGIGDQAGPSGAGRSTVGLHHLAWEVGSLREVQAFAHSLKKAGVLFGMLDHSTTKSLYGHDPDGIQFEIVWIVPAHRLDEATLELARQGDRPLDLAKEVERYGADTLGGYGIGQAVRAGA